MLSHRIALRRGLLPGALALAACTKDVTSPPVFRFTHSPCLGGDTIVLLSAQTVRLDCSNGGTTVTLTGGGASYLIVPQFATDQAINQFVDYTMSTGVLTGAVTASSRVRAPALSGFRPAFGGDGLPAWRPNLAQRAADRLLRSSARQNFRGGSVLRAPQRLAAVQLAPPPVGSVASFHVRSSFSTATWKTVGAKLVFAGANVLLYIDTLAPANGFTSTQDSSFGQYFDQTWFPIDTTAFGSPSDVDQNGRVIVLLSPVVNADTPAATCAANGFVAGFFDEVDFLTTDPNSNQGEIFYSIVPDPAGTVSCAHSVDDVNFFVPAVFLHELQHLISFSQHVVIGGGQPGASWLDEGLSIVAEELGSLYYEQKCPAPACRANASQLFPDSSQAFVGELLNDSYDYALLPDTASITLSDDSEGGFSWRGGAWLLVRWLADQFGSGIYRGLEHGSSSGVTAIEQASGQSFPALFANFGLALYTDSLPGLSRTAAPAANRFVTRNVKQLWARWFATHNGPNATVPYQEPVQLFQVTADTSTLVMVPGTMTYFRLDVPAGAVTIRFATPAGAGFPAALKPQLAIFRLPAGQ